MPTTLWRYSSLYIPKVKIRDMIEFLWLQNVSREMVKNPLGFHSVSSGPGIHWGLNGLGFSSFSSLSFLLQFSWPQAWEMTPIKTLWGQGWLMYHWPQIIQDVAKPQFLSCLPSTPSCPMPLRTISCQGLELVSLSGPGLCIYRLDMSLAGATFAPCFYMDTLQVQSPFIYCKDSAFLSTFLRYGFICKLLMFFYFMLVSWT